MLGCVRQVGDVNGAETHGAHDDEDDMTTMRIGVVAIALSMACGLVLGKSMRR